MMPMVSGARLPLPPAVCDDGDDDDGDDDDDDDISVSLLIHFLVRSSNI